MKKLLFIVVLLAFCLTSCAPHTIYCTRTEDGVKFHTDKNDKSLFLFRKSLPKAEYVFEDGDRKAKFDNKVSLKLFEIIGHKNEEL